VFVIEGQGDKYIYCVAVTERDFYSVFLNSCFVLTDEMLVAYLPLKSSYDPTVCVSRF